MNQESVRESADIRNINYLCHIARIKISKVTINVFITLEIIETLEVPSIKMTKNKKRKGVVEMKNEEIPRLSRQIVVERSLHCNIFDRAWRD